MKNEKLIVLLLGICLATGLVTLYLTAACVVSAQGTAPQATPREQVRINILGGPFGTSSYVATFTLADIISKKSPWLRANAIESKGAVQNILAVSKSPEKKKNHVIMSSADTMGWAKMGRPPFETKYKGFKAVARFNQGLATFITLNPNIKTVQDFLGKKLALHSTGSSSATLTIEILEQGCGIPFSKFNVQYLGWTGATEALADGLVDIAYVGNNRTEGGRVIPNPDFQKFLASVKGKRDVYFVNIPPEVIKKAREANGLPIWSELLEAGALGPQQTQRFYAFYSNLGWYADVELDAEIPYEICRIIYEYHKEMWPSHILLSYLTPQTAAGMEGKEEDFHPGAIKLYKEKGVKIGIEQ